MTQLRSKFDQLDANADGKVDVTDLKEILTRMGYQVGIPARLFGKH